MPDLYERRDTMTMDISSKGALFEQRHPIIRELQSIDPIIFPEEEKDPAYHLSLKELFRRKNMDLYHVDCLILRKIALHMIKVQKELSAKGIYPGLYALEDIYVNLNHSSCPICLTNPERFQLLDLEQDYEWYPEDERIFGEISLFHAQDQEKANQRILYKILIASCKGNVKVPPRENEQDYSSLFYATLPAQWKEVFEKEEVRSCDWWQIQMEQAIEREEYFEKKAREQIQEEAPQEPCQEEKKQMLSSVKMQVLYVLLQSNPNQSLEMSRMLYELQDQLELEEEHAGFLLKQGFLYGDGAIKQRDFQIYPKGFRLQLKQHVGEYSTVETILIACQWMKEVLKEKDSQCRMYLLTDGKIENNEMFLICLDLLKDLQKMGLQIDLRKSKEADCEGWKHLGDIVERGS